MAMVMLLGCYIGGKVLVATYIISKTCAQVTKNQLSEALVVLLRTVLLLGAVLLPLHRYARFLFDLLIRDILVIALSLRQNNLETVFGPNMDKKCLMPNL